MRIGGGFLRIAAGAVSRDVRLRSTGARTAARGLGIALGAFGFTYVEYRRPAPPRGLGR